MCGHCTEWIAFNQLEQGQGHRRVQLSDGLACEFYLQEADDPYLALKKINAAARRHEVDPQKFGLSAALLCRGIDVLLGHGFDSPPYQQLLRNRRFRRAVATSCSVVGQQKFMALASTLAIEPLGALYDEATFTDRGAASRLKLIVPFQSASVAILRHYIQWWLLGEGVKKNDLLKQMEETGILDPIEDVSTESREAFDALFPALWYSLNFLGPYAADRTMLWELVTTPLNGVPWFYAHDLWLQRRAALFLYDREGFHPFFRGLGQYRTSLILYLDLKRGLGAEQKDLLRQALNALPLDGLRDDDLQLGEWLAGSVNS